MIERPEAVTIARQLDQDLTGGQVAAAQRENSPHKFAFYSRSAEEYESIPVGQTVGSAFSDGSSILLPLSKGDVLQLGDGGETILLLAPDARPPKKHHLLWEFTDGRRLVVTVQGWGMVRLLDADQFAKWQAAEGNSVDLLSDAFTYECFCEIVKDYAAECDKSVKALLVNRPRVRGIGNGYLQDILFRAGLHPTQPVRQLSAARRRKLYQAIRAVLGQAAEKGGRDDEKDIFGRGGGYIRQMDKRTFGTPCPTCGAAIEKLSYLGGTCYLCPTCQPKSA